MTSIIGYADMLRSTELDEEDAFMAANFIFSEGKRLEAMSLKLMDLVVLDKNDYKLVRGYARRALGHVVAVVTSRTRSPNGSPTSPPFVTSL